MSTSAVANAMLIRNPGLGQYGTARQGGLVLLLGLALLAGLSLLALLAASSMLQQQQMAANHADTELSRLSAMAAVTAGEKLVLGLPDASRAENCLSDCFVEPSRSWFLLETALPPQPEYQTDEWWMQWGHPLSSAPEKDQSGPGATGPWLLPGRNPPRFIIQEIEFQATASASDPGLPAVAGVGYYQILGRGTGSGASSTHVVESILARPWLAGTTQDQPAAGDCRLFEAAFDCGRMAYRERR